MSRASARELAPVFAALGDETRLRLVSRLCAEGPLERLTETDVAHITRQALTKHLEALADAGVIDGTRGRPRVWRIKPGRLDDARRSLERISQQWDEALGRLKAFVEED